MRCRCRATVVVLQGRGAVVMLQGRGAVVVLQGRSAVVMLQGRGAVVVLQGKGAVVVRSAMVLQCSGAIVNWCNSAVVLHYSGPEVVL
jgi:hypothetical protein